MTNCVCFINVAETLHLQTKASAGTTRNNVVLLSLSLPETEYESDEGDDHHHHLHHHHHAEEEGQLLLQLVLYHRQAAVGVDVERRADSVKDVTAAVVGGLVAARVRHRVVGAAVVDLPVRVAGVEVESPTAGVLALQGVPGLAEGLVSHVLLHHPADVGGQKLLLEHDALELRAAVGGDGRRGAGGEEEGGGEEERGLPGAASTVQESHQGSADSAQQVDCGAEEEQVRQELEPVRDQDQALDTVEVEEEEAGKQ